MGGGDGCATRGPVASATVRIDRFRRYSFSPWPSSPGAKLWDDSVAAELVAVTQRLLEAIAAKDWATYESLCDAGLTCFE